MHSAAQNFQELQQVKIGGGGYPETTGPKIDPYDQRVRTQGGFLIPGLHYSRLIGVRRFLPGKNLLSFRYH